METPGCSSADSNPYESSSKPSSVDENDSVGWPDREDVAIIGMSCRTAGGVNTNEKLWQFLLDKKDASGEVPAWRWEPWYRRDVRNAKEIEKTLNRGYFIEDLENFDASFFGISPKEAEQMDPHQRLGLELSWEALENAGVDPKSLSGSDTAVYMGIDSDDYSRLVMEDLPNIEAHMGIGTTAHGLANRISYHLDLMGPSSAVDAACASSLIAVHLGRQAILNRESEVAIVGAVNVLLAPAITRMLGKAGALSPDGVCRSFDEEANGYARGEGGAVVVLKRLSTAMADGDNILAVCKGSAIAQDGKTNGIMAPNAKAQEIVARNALARGNVDPLTVGYVEAHATATPLGDPTEMSALAAVYGYGAGRPIDSPISIGSIKPNFGHLEAAAGAIGLVKAVLAVNKGQLAPQTRLNKLTSRVDWKASGLQVVQETTEWTNTNGPRRAAVCSYGYGGTVSHAVIEEWSHCNIPDPDPDSLESAQLDPTILVLSALQDKRLGQQATVLADWLASPSGKAESLQSIATTLAQRRAHHDCRAAFVVSSHQDAVEKLRAFASANGEPVESIARGRVLGVSSDKSRHGVWVFSGHGAQWRDMGRELLQDPHFYEAVSALENVYVQEAGFSLLDALRDGDFETSQRVQCLTYAVQIGLSRVLVSKGLQPQAVIGHSVGEIAASVVAGCLTVLEGALIVIRRSKLYEKVRAQGPGAMALVNVPFSQVQSELGERKDLVAAIDSSPSSCVVSGTQDAVDEYEASLKAQGVKTFRVKTDIAFHCPVLEQLSEPLEEVLAGVLQPRPSTIPIYSTSLEDTRSSAPRDIEYWINNMISPVQLNSAVNAAAEDGYRIFFEVSSHPIVSHSVQEILVTRGIDEEDMITPSTMRRNFSARWSIQNAVAQLYTSGASVDFGAQLGHRRHWCKTVPPTVWVHKPYYKKVETGPLGQGITHDVEKHQLLGQRVAVANTDVVLYTTKLDEKTKPYPGDHPFDGTEIIPAGVYINTYHYATGCPVLHDIKLQVPVSMSTETRDVQVIVKRDSASVASSLSSDMMGGEPSWVYHSNCRWNAGEQATQSSQIFDLDAARKRIGTILPNEFSAEYLRKIGVEGIAFPWQVLEHYGNEKEMLTRVDMDPSVEKLPWHDRSWSPVLDSATTVGSVIFFNNPQLRIASGVDRVELISTDPLPKVVYLYIEEASDDKGMASHVTVLDEQGWELAKFHSLRFADVEAGSSAGVSGSVESLVYPIRWIPPKFMEKPRPFDHVLLVSDDPDLTDKYYRQLRPQTETLDRIANTQDLERRPDLLSGLGARGSAIVYVPSQVKSLDEVSAKTEEFIWETASLVRIMSQSLSDSQCKLFVITSRVHAGDSVTGLAHGALYGLARIAASEHPDLWGGLIDNEEPSVFPTLAVRYVQGYDVIRVVDGLPRCPMMRPLSREQLHKPGSNKTLLPKPEGTYVITGGLGNLGLETSKFLVEKGARRIVLISRSKMPRRSTWQGLVDENNKLSPTIQKIRELEKLGASIHTVALDMSASDAEEKLLDAIDALSLPPVLGVVHAAGVLEDSLLLDTTRDSFARVLAPKIQGALALNAAFPPNGDLDFFVMYSSIGQLMGTAGQASYGSGNAFLDALATHRRRVSNGADNAVAFQWTAWRGIGMATATEFLTVELLSKNITDISADEAFAAWTHMSAYDVESAVITRCRPLEEGEEATVGMLEEVVPRIQRVQQGPSLADTEDSNSAQGAGNQRPSDPQELGAWLNTKIRECIANVLLMSDMDEVDPRTPVADMGVDSVLTVALRQRLQSALSVKVPPTLTWNHPTVNHLVAWFRGRFAEEEEKGDK